MDIFDDICSPFNLKTLNSYLYYNIWYLVILKKYNELPYFKDQYLISILIFVRFIYLPITELREMQNIKHYQNLLAWNPSLKLDLETLNHH